VPAKPLVKLTFQAKRFCREYVVDGVGTHAAIRAGYSEKSAHTQASMLLKDPLVKDEIERLEAERNRALDLDAEWVRSRLMVIADLDPTQLHDEEGRLLPLSTIPVHARKAIAGLETEVTHKRGSDDEEYVTVRKVKTVDKARALEMLGKSLSMFTDNVKHEGDVTINVKTGIEDGEEEPDGAEVSE